MTRDIRKNMKEGIDKKLQERIEEATAIHYMINLLDPALTTWEGKQVTKRLITKLQTLIPEDFYLYIHNTYGNRIELCMSRGTKKISVELCDCKDGKTLRMSYVREHNKYLYDQTERYEKATKAKEKVSEWVDEYLAIRQQVVDLKAKMKEYNCEYDIDWTDLRYTI